MPDPTEPATGSASRLARSSSAYLRSAAGQPIAWYPWGREPFDLARRTNRPIVLDIGASWCHWCHVMDEGTYADVEVTRLLAEHFVAVKVDRDEHPEVDRRYQRQVGALSGEGGWPLTAFLTPDGDVFLGGTYFPPTDGHGRPGFRRVLAEVARLWRDEPVRVRENATAVQDALVRMAGRPSDARPGSDLAPFVDGVLGELEASFDPLHGGFGGAPKFPHPSAVALLLWDEQRAARPSSGERALETLGRMADGGIYDQLGGGFHRYSVDEGWRVPHFEKMGIDNAELLLAYIEGFRRSEDPRFAEVVRGTVGWCEEVLGDRGGGWGASQDADNAPGDDGSYFTWSRAELRAELEPEEYRLIARAFGVGTEARMPHDPERNVLFWMLPIREAVSGLELARPPEEVFRTAVAKLRTARARRPTPIVDPALYASINGRLVGSFALAAVTFGEPTWLDAASRAADRWLRDGYEPTRGVAHRLGADGPSGFGLLDDQVAFARGLLEVAIARAEPRYLNAARELLELLPREFAGEDGLLRDVAPRLYDGPDVGGALRPAYPLEDSPHLSANAGAALAYLRLATVLGDETWTERARRLLGPMAARIGGAGVFAAGAALAAGLAETPRVHAIVEGSGPLAETLARTAHRAASVHAVVFRGRPPVPFSLPSELVGPAGDAERALVCFGHVCAPPVTDVAALSRLLRAGRALPA